jgi:hypothetical protein
MTQMEAAGTKSADERKAILDRAVADAIRVGYRIESRSDFQAALVRGRRVNHVLHLILTLVTFGLWAIVWIIVAIAGGEKREVVTVDDFGRTSRIG